MSGHVRIRLNFQGSPAFPDMKNCWFLVDTSTCCTISDLEYLIMKRFELTSKNVYIHLFLDDYLLPSREKIEVIQHNDKISVKVAGVVTQQSSEESESDPGPEKRMKRKQSNSSEWHARTLTAKRNQSNEASQGNSHKFLQKGDKPRLGTNTGKRKSTMELSKSNSKKSKTKNVGSIKTFSTLQNGLLSSSSSSESDSSSEPTFEQPIERKQRHGNFKSLAQPEKRKTIMKETAKDFVKSKQISSSSSSSSDSSDSPISTGMLARSNSKRKEKEEEKTTLKGISKDLDRKHETNIDSDSSDSSSSEETLSKSNPKMKHHVGNQKTNDEKGQARKLQRAKKDKKEVVESDSSTSDSSSSEESSSEHPSEKRGNSVNFKVVCMKKKTFSRGIVKNGDNEGARVGVTNGKTDEQSTVLQGSKKEGKGVTEEDSSSSDSSEIDQSVNAATMASGLQNKQPLSLSSMSKASPSVSNRDAKADSIHNKRSQDKKKKDGKSKNMSSSSTALLSSSRTLSSSSLPRPKTAQNTRTPTGQTPTRLLSKGVDGIASPSALSINPAKQGNSQPRTSIQSNQKLVSSLGNLSSSHIRFDSDEDDAEGQQDGGTTLSNITDSFNEAKLNTATKGGQIKSIDQTISCKDMEIKETTQRDYTSCIPLCGPPRAGDKIAYKVLELSASYTPELSNYKHGTVISYEASTGDVTMNLAKESLIKTQGDGNVSRKFELVYEEDEEDQSKEENEKLETLVVVPWSTIVEAVFVED